MKTRTLIKALFLFAIGASTMALTGCNTWDGAGEDVERTGEYMQGEG